MNVETFVVMLLVVGDGVRIMDDREMDIARARSRVGAVIFGNTVRKKLSLNIINTS